MKPELMNALWGKLSDIAAEALRMTDGEADSLRASRVARLVGLLPFLAGCDDAERTALSHLATLVVAGRGQARAAFDHCPADDAEPLARLRTISDFKGGDEAVISRGLALLGLCMAAGYRRDAEVDGLLGAYNPVLAAAEAASRAEATLRRALESGAPNDADTVLSIAEAEKGYWKN